MAGTQIDIPMTGAPSVAYGTVTGAAAITTADGLPLSAQPRYLLERFSKDFDGKNAFYYRITVRAQGLNSNTVVWLQEVFTP